MLRCGEGIMDVPDLAYIVEDFFCEAASVFRDEFLLHAIFENRFIHKVLDHFGFLQPLYGYRFGHLFKMV